MRQLKITKQVTNRETASLDKYLQEIGKVDLITADEEVELAQRIKAGDQAALEKLTKANLRFVVSVAKQYQNQGLTLPDLINEGNLGLIKAAQRFDETRGFKFISYAVWWIRQSILQALAEHGGMAIEKTRLINRIYDTSEGRVLIDGVDVREWNLAALRSQMATIEQDVYLFSQSVAQNITFGCDRQVVDRVHREVDRGGGDVTIGIGQRVGEGVGPVEVGVRDVGERTVGVQDKGAAGRVAAQFRGQSVTVAVTVVAQHTRRRHVQDNGIGRAVGVIHRRRRRIHRWLLRIGDGRRGGVRVRSAVVVEYRKADGVGAGLAVRMARVGRAAATAVAEAPVPRRWAARGGVGEAHRQGRWARGGVCGEGRGDGRADADRARPRDRTGASGRGRGRSVEPRGPRLRDGHGVALDRQGAGRLAHVDLLPLLDAHGAQSSSACTLRHPHRAIQADLLLRV